MKINYMKYLISFNLVLAFSSSTVIASNQKTDITPPRISYSTENRGDRESIVVTLNVSDESGVREFRDPKGNLIEGNSTVVEFDKRGPSTFTAIDNYGNRSEVEIDLSWINPYSEGVTGQAQRGSFYWTSSNMREWLNSDASIVGYTSNPPSKEHMDYGSYDKEAGFLSQFTDKEKDAIAITERRVLLADLHDKAVEGGTINMPHANINGGSMLAGYADNMIRDYKKYRYKKELDKVFLLNTNEMYWYIVRRGYSFEKRLTPEAQKKHNKPLIHRWWVQGSAPWRDFEWGYSAEKMPDGCSQLRIAYANEFLGVVPSINIKPSYVFEDGRKASELNIGEEVVFGTYLNAPITWQVINISDSGYPLLISKNILDLKKFDALGDKSRIYSDYINYKKADTYMFDDIEYKSTSQSPDIDIPKMRIVDESPIQIRQNEPYMLSFIAEDVGGSGIKQIELPNGKIIKSNEFEYKIDSNKPYVFRLIDNAGNYTEFTLPIGNINQEPELEISSSHPEGWSNKDVEVFLKSSNSVRYELKNSVMTNKAEISKSLFPNYVGYGNRTFRIRGKAKLLSYNEKARGEWYGLGFSYKSSKKNDYGYRIDGHWDRTAHLIQIDDMINSPNQEVEFDIEYSIPSNYSHELTPWAQSSINPTAGECFTIELSVVYELTDDSDFSISSIVLPDGKEVNDVKSYTDVITEEGIHTLNYKVLDNRGKVTEKEMVVKIDKTAPILNLNYKQIPGATSSDIPVKISGSDALSGLKFISLPDGNSIQNNELTYTVIENGQYQFKAVDLAGNETIKTVDIQNIDKEVTGVDISQTPKTPTNGSVLINLRVNDYSGVNYIITPTLQKIFSNEISYAVNLNGRYSFLICDNANNLKTVDILISNIDKNKPSVGVAKNPNTEWSNVDVDVSIDAID